MFNSFFILILTLGAISSLNCYSTENSSKITLDIHSFRILYMLNSTQARKVNNQYSIAVSNAIKAFSPISPSIEVHLEDLLSFANLCRVTLNLLNVNALMVQPWLQLAADLNYWRSARCNFLSNLDGLLDSAESDFIKLQQKLIAYRIISHYLELFRMAELNNPLARLENRIFNLTFEIDRLLEDISFKMGLDKENIIEMSSTVHFDLSKSYDHHFELYKKLCSSGRLSYLKNNRKRIEKKRTCLKRVRRSVSGRFKDLGNDINFLAREYQQNAGIFLLASKVIKPFGNGDDKALSIKIDLNSVMEPIIQGYRNEGLEIAQIEYREQVRRLFEQRVMEYIDILVELMERNEKVIADAHTLEINLNRQMESELLFNDTLHRILEKKRKIHRIYLSSEERVTSRVFKTIAYLQNSEEYQSNIEKLVKIKDLNKRAKMVKSNLELSLAQLRQKTKEAVEQLPKNLKDSAKVIKGIFSGTKKKLSDWIFDNHKDKELLEKIKQKNQKLEI